MKNTIVKTINKKISSASVVVNSDSKSHQEDSAKNTEAQFKEIMNESIERPYELNGSTYKLMVPDHISKDAIYITINDIVLNEGEDDEEIRPFEVFINSKNMKSFEWISALTRILSAVFRKGGDVSFVKEELTSIYNPSGGYWNKGVWRNSVLCDIGDIIGDHIDMVKAETNMIRNEASENNDDCVSSTSITNEPDQFYQLMNNGSSSQCPNCNEMSYVSDSGCATCHSCGYSQCG